jgi:hypothetical protein
MKSEHYEVLNVEGGRHVKMWTRGVPVDESAKKQLENIARMPFVHSHLAVMPDVHLGKGATVGSVIATKGAIIPAAVGVDIGCGMMAVQTTLKAKDLPSRWRTAFTHRARRAARFVQGAWSVRPRFLGQHAGLGAYALGNARGPSRGHRREVPAPEEQGAAQAARHSGRRQPLHRGLPRHRADRVGDVALGFARNSATWSASCSSSWHART